MDPSNEKTAGTGAIVKSGDTTGLSDTQKRERSPAINVKNAWYEWADGSTMHGIKFVCARDVWVFKRLFWVTAIGLFIYLLVLLTTRQFDRYAARKTVTKTTSYFVESLQFPAITVCNYNYIRNSSITDPKDRELIKHLLMTYPVNRTHIEALGEDYLNNISIGNFFFNGAFTIEEMFHSCVWNSALVDCGAIMTRTLSDTGYCYTFNAGNVSGPEYATTIPGHKYGLELTMLTGQDDYFFGDSAAAGFKVVVHEPSEYPDINFATSVGPGHIHFLAVTRQENKYLPLPVLAFGSRECVETDADDFDNTLHYHDTYSLSACMSECQANFFYNACGCIGSLVAGHGKKECGPLRYIDCAQDAYTNFSAQFNVCNCPMPCKTVSYKVFTSAAYLPNVNILKLLNYNQTSVDFLRKNLIQLRVFYESNVVMRNEQVLEFTTEDLYAAFGGYVGLAIGASAVTALEFLELIFVSAFRCITGH